MINRIANAICLATPAIEAAQAAVKLPVTGSLDILNCGAGHLRFGFDSSNAAEVERAKSVIQDMLKRGYMLFVQKGAEHVRVRSFDPSTCEYLIEEPEPEVLAATEPTVEPTPKKSRGRPKLQRASMSQSKATAIAPTAGG